MASKALDDRVSRAVASTVGRTSGSGRTSNSKNLDNLQNDEDVTPIESMRRMTGNLPSSEDGRGEGWAADAGGSMTRLQYSESIRRWAVPKYLCSLHGQILAGPCPPIDHRSLQGHALSNKRD